MIIALALLASEKQPAALAVASLLPVSLAGTGTLTVDCVLPVDVQSIATFAYHIDNIDNISTRKDS